MLVPVQKEMAWEQNDESDCPLPVQGFLPERLSTFFGLLYQGIGSSPQQA
jgi:hypothetical protein